MIADGKLIAQHIETELQEKLAHAPQKRVCFIQFGNNPASSKFIEMKSRVAKRLGIHVDLVRSRTANQTSVQASLPWTGEGRGEVDSMTINQAISLIQEVVARNYNGIVVQLPLPPGLDTQAILNAVPQALDIDVLSDKSKEAYRSGTSAMVPPVARAVWEILKFYNIQMNDKDIVLLGNGALVGAPVAAMLDHEHIPYHIVDKDTDADLRADLLENADIIISGVGIPGLLQPDMIKQGVVLIDAGTSEQHGKLAGDIDPACAEKAALITPVPGGVGPVTVVSLFTNLVHN